MNVVSAIIVYILIWWLVLFTVLPQGVRSVWEDEEGTHAPGVDPGAPVDPQLKKKAIRTTWISFIIWAIVCVVISTGVIDFRN